jgi:hypothetical protein
MDVPTSGPKLESYQQWLSQLPDSSWNNTMFYAQNFFQPEMKELAKANALGFEAYSAQNFWKENQLWILAGSAALVALLVIGKRR